MTTAYYSPAECKAHDMGFGHPECPARLDAINDHLRATGLDIALDVRDAPEAPLEALARAHAAGYVAELADMLQAAEAAGAMRAIDPDTTACPATRRAALRAAGAALAATDAVLSGSADNAFCAVRPPGHHATADTAMGFCLFNNVAVAAAHALDKHRLERVAVIDFDVHHGNGSQDIFWREPRVAYFSTHESGIYPHTGQPGERGAGNIHNRLLPPGSDGLRFRNVWADELLPLLDGFKPQLLLVSAGFDAHRRDPLADLMLEAEDFAWLTRELRARARRHAGGRLVSLLEGGYDLEALRESAAAHVTELS
jgi:acetoin utilization deacetylase AcuC-like enzyme